MNFTLDPVNLLATLAVLLKLINLSREWGRLEQKVEVHDKEIALLRKGVF